MSGESERKIKRQEERIAYLENELTQARLRIEELKRVGSWTSGRELMHEDDSNRLEWLNEDHKRVEALYDLTIMTGPLYNASLYEMIDHLMSRSGEVVPNESGDL